jgi:hypothetical protein
MNRKTFLQRMSLAGMAALIPGRELLAGSTLANKSNSIPNDRQYWVDVMVKIAHPVLHHLSNGTLKQNMPVRSNGDSRAQVTYLEALGRTLAGISPWLALGEGNDAEGQLRAKYAEMSRRAIAHAVDPESPDFMNFTQHGQPLVDAAFLAHGILRAPDVLFHPLSQKTKNQLIDALKSSRAIQPGFSNWLLFSAMVEAFLLEFTGDYDTMRMDYAIRQHMQWYVGDGVYSDGPEFAFDYYNSYVIQPFLVDIAALLKRHNAHHGGLYDIILKRSQRFAEIQEHLISPEGTFPVTGRSIPYRFGAFQSLAQMALLDTLPENIHPAQVRAALTKVIFNCIEPEGTFDENGWLHIGLAGHQPDMAETYLSTGSMYLCTVGMLPLGLPATHSFWAEPARDWTSRLAWAGIDVGRDKALKNS